MSRWKRIDCGFYGALPKRPGVYCLYPDLPFPMYIGSTRNLRARLGNHFDFSKRENPVKTKWGEFSRVLIKWREEKEIGEAAMAEIKLIRRLHPELNKTHNA